MITEIERLSREYFKEVIDEEALYNYRPDWLINPRTVKKLETDIFYPNFKLAIEVNSNHRSTGRR